MATKPSSGAYRARTDDNYGVNVALFQLEQESGTKIRGFMSVWG